MIIKLVRLYIIYVVGAFESITCSFQVSRNRKYQFGSLRKETGQPIMAILKS